MSPDRQPSIRRPAHVEPRYWARMSPSERRHVVRHGTLPITMPRRQHMTRSTQQPSQPRESIYSRIGPPPPQPDVYNTMQARDPQGIPRGPWPVTPLLPPPQPHTHRQSQDSTFVRAQNRRVLTDHHEGVWPYNPIMPSPPQIPGVYPQTDSAPQYFYRGMQVLTEDQWLRLWAPRVSEDPPIPRAETHPEAFSSLVTPSSIGGPIQGAQHRTEAEGQEYDDNRGKDEDEDDEAEERRVSACLSGESTPRAR